MSGHEEFNSQPTFATNRENKGEAVADAINGLLHGRRLKWRSRPVVAIATAYFNPEGFMQLADELEQTGGVRLLLGVEPESQEERTRRTMRDRTKRAANRDRIREALAGHVRSIEESRDLLGFTPTAREATRRLVTWLRTPGVEVRRHTQGFLHGKAFVVDDDQGGVVAGSSNFTYAGLRRNLELNLGHYDPDTLAKVREWFEELWTASSPFDLASIYEQQYVAHAPWTVFLRMLHEQYGAELEAEAEDPGDPVLRGLTEFQRHGVWRAKRILDHRHGVLIADEVGLGKTFLAGALLEERRKHRQRSLVVGPAALRHTWGGFLLGRQLGVEYVSYEDVVARKERFDDYAMVVVDEAHALRNLTTQRSEAMQLLFASGDGKAPRDVVFLTATPVNNSLDDLRNLLFYFVKNDAEFAAVGIPSLDAHFREAAQMDPEDLSPEHLFDVLDAVAVRRTRHFVKRFYQGDEIVIDGRRQPITFPTPRVVKVTYDLDAVLPGFFDEVRAVLGGEDRVDTTEGTVTVITPPQLTLARYMPSLYATAGEVEQFEVQNAGLLRSMLLKRFESSGHAFARTCRTMLGSHEAFLALLDDGWVASGEAFREWMGSTAERFEDAIDVERWKAEGKVDHVANYDVDRLRSDVAGDMGLLDGLATRAETITREQDPKLAAVVNELAAIAADAEASHYEPDLVRDRRKVLVFTYFADTAAWIADHLRVAVEDDPRLAAYRGRIGVITGSSSDRDEVVLGFAPRTMGTKDHEDTCDLLVTTDVLAEGVNLQQARHIVNYDLPWNPMRLVQRHGRVDRIGSQHTEVFLRCFFPDARLDDLLRLEARLRRKLMQAAKSIGVGDVIPGVKGVEINITEDREEIERLAREEAGIFEDGGTGKSVLTGEELRQTLREAWRDPTTRDGVLALPWGSGSGFIRTGATPGYVFCARVLDSERPLFRWVPVNHDGTFDDPVIDALSALSAARPPDGPATTTVLAEETFERAFAAWDLARNSIVERWNFASDPANLTPEVPRAMRRAAQFLREHPGHLTVEETNALMDALENPYPERILREVRRILDADATPADRVELLRAYAETAGLRRAEVPETLPEIDHDDVHLMCWVAVGT